MRIMHWNRVLRMVDQRKYLVHPHYILLTLVLGSMSALFLGFSAAYLYSRVSHGIPPVRLPSLFYFNTLILLVSSWTLMRAKRAYVQDNTRGYKSALFATLLLSIAFLIAQIFAWRQLLAAEIRIDDSNMASYLYVISAVHFAHVIAGIPFLILFLRNAILQMKKPVSVLVYFSDPDKRRKLRLLTIYWHFLDFLWIYLVIFFLVNYWLS